MIIIIPPLVAADFPGGVQQVQVRLTQAAAFASLSNQWALLNIGIISLCGPMLL